jgi:hypothetical protein
VVTASFVPSRFDMQFVYPGFLFALSALSIPIIIHLFNFRRFKKIFFTNVRFLQEIKQDTRSRSRLKHLLILLCRLLAVAFLVLAFAQPFIPSSQSNLAGGLKNVSIYIDNSFSMDAVGKTGSLLETAKRKAREIATAYQPADRFQLLTNDFEARHQRVVSREEFLQMVDEVKSGSSVRKLSEVVSRQQDALRNAVSQKIHLYEISDFQKTTSDVGQLKNDSLVQVSMVPLPAAEEKNIFLDTCSLSTPFVQLNSPNELTVRLQNLSDDDAESVPVKLFVNGAQRSLTSVSIPARSSAETKLSFTIAQPGWQQAVVSVTDYPVTFDDSYYFSFEVKDHLNVLSINGGLPSTYIDALFANDPYFQLRNTSVNQVDYSSFSGVNLIILQHVEDISSGLAQEMKKYLLQGGSLIVFPAPEINTVSYMAFFQSVNADTYTGYIESDDRVAFIEKKSPLFADVFEKKNASENTDLPLVRKHYQRSGNARSSAEVLMRLQSGDAFLTAMQVEKGTLYTSASPLDAAYTNFPMHALFVPVMLKAAMSGFNPFQQPQVVGRNSDIEIPSLQLSGETVLHLLNKEQKFDLIPEIRMINNKPVIAAHGHVKNAGNYTLESEGRILSSVSYNYDRRESDLACYSSDELKALAEKAGLQSLTLFDGNKELTHTVAQLNTGTRLWKYCVWLALLFLLCEVLVIRLMSSTKPLTTNTSRT